MKHFKITFTINYHDGRAYNESIIVEALHDKDAVIKFAKAFPDAQITEFTEISETFEE